MIKIGVGRTLSGRQVMVYQHGYKFFAGSLPNPADPWTIYHSKKRWPRGGQWHELSEEEREAVRKKFGRPLRASFAKNRNGYFCYTHRARTKPYPAPDKIPINKYKFIVSTG